MHAVWIVLLGPTVSPFPVHPVWQITVGDLGREPELSDHVLRGSYQPSAGHLPLHF